MKKILLAICALALALGFSMPVSAAIQTTTIPVSVTITPTVTVSATSFDFGSVQPNTLLATGTAIITVNATSGTPYTVTLDAGLNYGFNWAGARNLKSGAVGGAAYALYQDATRTTQWGDTGFANTIAGNGVAGTGSSMDQTLPVYGFITTGSTAGTYSDTVTVTVNY